MESSLNLTAVWDTLPDQTTKWKATCSERPDTDLAPFQTPCSRGWPQVVQNSHRAASQLRAICVRFSNWQFKRSEKDWINLNFTAARLQWVLCVCLYYYLSGCKCPSAFTCPWKDERNNAVFNFGSCFKSILLWFFFPGKKAIWRFLALPKQYSADVFDVKIDLTLLLLLQLRTPCFYHHLALNSLHHP